MPDLRKFGRFEIKRKLATGGMAEIYLADWLGSEGFRKTVVLKRIHPSLSGDSKFVSMFIDEARIAAALDHENIVKVFDFGTVEGNYYLAMEYLQGRDLAFVLDRLAFRSELLPVEAAVFIVREVAAGLSHAHAKTDDDGEPLGIVHRDVNPHNIMLTLEGAVKILDFGIARARIRSGAPTVGEIKGKVAYMSPEQARGEPPGPQSDVYSLGLVLYETATGHQVLSGDSDVEILEKARRPVIVPPTEISEAIDPDLGEIIMRALAPESDRRYASAAAMEEALEACARTRLPPFSRKDLARWMSEHFSSAGTDPRSTEVLGSGLEEAEVPPSGVSDQKEKRESLPMKNRGFRLWMAILLALTMIAATVLVFDYLNAPTAPESSDAPAAGLLSADGLMVNVRPAGALVAADGEYRGQAPLILESRIVSGRPRIQASLPGYRGEAFVQRMPKQGTGTVDVSLQRACGFLDLGNLGDRAVAVDGRLVQNATEPVPLSVGLHEVVVEKKGTFWSDVHLVPVLPGGIASINPGGRDRGR